MIERKNHDRYGTATARTVACRYRYRPGRRCGTMVSALVIMALLLATTAAAASAPCGSVRGAAAVHFEVRRSTSHPG